jgi:single-strand DNA-binding protein
MAGETIITVVGNLTRDPELRTIGSGSTVVNFTIAASTRQYNRNTNQWEDGDTLFMNCSAWDSARTTLASNIASSLSKGTRVIAQGRLTQRSYQAQDGTQRTVVELRVDEIGPSLSRATAQVTRQASSGQGGFQGRSNGGYQGGQSNAGSGYGGGNQGGQPNGGYQPNQGGYQGGAGYSQQPAPSNSAAPAADPWGNAGSSDSGSFGTFGSSSDFGGGDDSDPEF